MKTLVTTLSFLFLITAACVEQSSKAESKTDKVFLFGGGPIHSSDSSYGKDWGKDAEGHLSDYIDIMKWQVDTIIYRHKTVMQLNFEKGHYGHSFIVHTTFNVLQHQKLMKQIEQIYGVERVNAFEDKYEFEVHYGKMFVEKTIQQRVRSLINKHFNQRKNNR